MKRITTIIMVVIILTSIMMIGVRAETYVSVTVEGESIEFPDAQPFIDTNNRTLVPVRFISEALGGQVDWNSNLQQVTITYDAKVIKLIIDKKEILINEKSQDMDTQAILKDSRTFVPVRFVSEAMGANVDWDSVNNTVVITLVSNDAVDLEGMTDEEIIQQLKEYPYIEDDFGRGFLKDNVWLVEHDGEAKIKEYVEIGKDYMESFYNVNYRTYDKTEYSEKLKWFFLESGSWIADDVIERDNEEHINYWANKIAEKEIIIHTEFITDETCIYTNGSTLIRGRMNYSIESCNDMEWLREYTRYGNVVLGKKYTCIVDVELADLARNAQEKWETAELLISDEYFVTQISEVKVH